MPVYTDPRLKPPDLARAAVEHARSMNQNVVILDTAGRLHIADDLMAELQQIKSKVQPHEIVLVADAMTGRTPCASPTS